MNRSIYVSLGINNAILVMGRSLYLSLLLQHEEIHHVAFIKFAQGRDIIYRKFARWRDDCMAKMSVNCVLVVISLLVSWFSTSEGKYLNNKQL